MISKIEMVGFLCVCVCCVVLLVWLLCFGYSILSYLWLRQVTTCYYCPCRTVV
jgi:hypothetical protein